MLPKLIKTGRAFIFVGTDRYKVSLAISLSLKASNIFPDREFWLKMVPNRNFLGNKKTQENQKLLQKLSFSYFKCVLNMKIHFVPNFVQFKWV